MLTCFTLLSLNASRSRALDCRNRYARFNCYIVLNFTKIAAVSRLNK